ncbi:putative monovalent cation/H+ antiporter subunit A [Prolixibacter sp. NT017]|uniref:putative monovalent cation/H+ antiporter subunit A n=1 Tax=Prolixibacter sp. NT017 TaxID=2652390 RepID=UPI001299221C|nr:putative monovalent cation/H+ antiporter subunit A [Prolixibacter sp. NT017]
MSLIWIVGLVFSLAFLAPFIDKRLGKISGYLYALLPAALFVLLIRLLPAIIDRHFIVRSIDWFPLLHVRLSFYLDGLSLLFGLLITGMGTLVLIYSGYYMQHYSMRGRFYFYILLFMGAMLGLVLANNLITLFVFWEITSFSSFLLIGFNHERPEARAAALQALLITGFGGLAMLAGFVLLGNVGGSYELTDLLQNGAVVKSSKMYVPLVLLIMVGAFTKSAQFPFHFWLPGAMEAPTPVSAYLHSATMVKAGIYLLARLQPILGGTDLWQFSLGLAGATTMLVGAYFAFTQTDLKKILAYTTISALGMLVLLVGMGTELAITAMVIFLIVHSLYKGALFMIAGAIDKTVGTRDIRHLGGMWPVMPIAAVATFLTLFSMAGLPPFLGFIGKEVIYDAKVQAPQIAVFLAILAVTANIFMVAVAFLFGHGVFFGKRKDPPKIPKEPAIPLLIGPAVLSVTSLFMGIYPAIITQPLVMPAIDAVNASPVDLHMKLWHGLNLVFLLSVITITLGLTLFFFRKPATKALRKFNQRYFRIEFTDLFRRLVENFLSFTKRHTEVVQHGYHRFYLMLIFIVSSLLVWYQLYHTRGWGFQASWEEIPFYLLGISLLIITSAIGAVFTRSRLVAIVLLGVIGYAMAFIFILYGAVDVAITLILVETLILVLFVMVIYHLPGYMPKYSRPSSRIRDGVIAIVFGGFMTALVLKAEFIKLSPPISDYFLKEAFTKGHGRNIVNVILVDFRGLDTMGETVVLVIAAIGVISLLKLKPKKKEEEE